MKNLSRIGAVVAGTALIATAATTGATAAKWIDGSDIKRGTVAGKQIKDSSIGSKDIANGKISLGDLSPWVQKQVKATGADGKTGPQGPKGEPGDPASDVFGTSAVGKTFDTVNVAKIGGSFTANATQVGTFDLEAGTYLISSDGFFISNAQTSGQTRMQLAIRGDDGSQFGSDLGTCFTGAASVLTGREVTCNTTRTVVVEEGLTVNVKAFGYADDQGSADSGLFDATVSVSAVKIG